jgi:hypothetical protein
MQVVDLCNPQTNTAGISINLDRHCPALCVIKSVFAHLSGSSF